MIFLTLIAAGALVGAAMRWGRGRRAGLAPQLGAGGAFLLGGLASGFATRSPGALDPVALAIGAAGAVIAVLLLDKTEGAPGDNWAGPAPRAK